jgi:hypothetical protein
MTVEARIAVKYVTELRLENTEVDNTWFSRAGVPPDIQVHTEREVWIALGKPQNIRVTIEPMDGSEVDY